MVLLQVNQKGLKLHCSHYKPFDTTAEHARPIVIYCHCNSGSRRDAEEAFYILLPRDVTVFCLDFAVRSSWLSWQRISFFILGSKSDMFCGRSYSLMPFSYVLEILERFEVNILDESCTCSISGVVAA